MYRPFAFESPGFRLSVAFFFGLLFNGVLGPFWPAWLAYRDMSAVEIGVLMSLLAWPKLLTNPIIGSFVDGRGHARGTMIFLGIALLAITLPYFWTSSFLAFALLTAALSCFAGGIGLLLDSVAMTLTTRGVIEYGRVRVWASIAFVLASVTSGNLVERIGPAIILPLLVGFCVIGVAGLVAAPPSERPVRGPKTAGTLLLFKDPAFVLCLLSACLTQGSHGVYNGFSVLHWTKNGLTGTEVGVLWALGTTAEIVIFFASRHIVARLGPARLLLLAAVASILRWTISGLSSDFAVLAPVQCLHALSFACCHLGAMHFIGRSVAPNLSTRAQAVYSSLVWGVTPGIMLFVSGALYDVLEGGAFFPMTGLAALSALVAWKLRQRNLRLGLAQA